MRNLTRLDRKARRIEPPRFWVEARQYGPADLPHAGRFLVASCIDRKDICVVATKGHGWDHVSFSRTDRIPHWVEAEQVKRLFFEDHETAMQLHVPAKDHVNFHPQCLHLWRPLDQEIPRPPGDFVGPS